MQEKFRPYIIGGIEGKERREVPADIGSDLIVPDREPDLERKKTADIAFELTKAVDVLVLEIEILIKDKKMPDPVLLDQLNILIKLGKFDAVFSFLEKQSLDIVNPKVCGLLDCLMDVGQIEKISLLLENNIITLEKNALDITEEKNYILLLALSRYGYAEAVAKLVQSAIPDIINHKFKGQGTMWLSRVWQLLSFRRSGAKQDVGGSSVFDITSGVTHDFVKRLIYLGLRSEAIEFLSKCSIDISDSSHLSFLLSINSGNELAVSSLLENAFAKISESEKAKMAHDIHLLYTLVDLHQDKIIATLLINQNTPFDISDFQSRRVIFYLLNTNHLDVVTQLLDQSGLELDNNTVDISDHVNLNLFIKLIAVGLGDKIKPLLENRLKVLQNSQINISDFGTQRTFLCLSKCGYAEAVHSLLRQVVEQLSADKIDIFAYENINIIPNLIELDATDMVRQLLGGVVTALEPDTVDISDDKTYSVLSGLVKFGYAESIPGLLAKTVAEIKTRNINVKNRKDRELLSRLVALGYEDIVFNVCIANKDRLDASQAWSGKVEKELSDSRTAIIERYRYFLKIVEVEATVKPLLDYAKKAIMKMGPIELFFLNLIINQNGFFGTKTLELMKGILTGGQFVADIMKSGSELHVAVGGEGAYVTDDAGEKKTFRPVFFMHRIPESSAVVWKNVHDAGIPVAPIIGEILPEKDKAVVISRYCGMSLDKCFGRYLHPVMDLLSYAVRCKHHTILKEIEELDGKRIKHGHTHIYNATVEWIKKSYLGDQIQKGKSINTVSFDPDEFTFDPATFLQNPDQWETVVRIIDWDQSKSTA